MKKLPDNRDPYLIRQHNLEQFRKDLTNRTEKWNEEPLGEDMDLIDMISNDISIVIGTCPEGDIYKASMPVVQVIDDNGIVRVYGLEISGGIALIFKRGNNSDSFNLLTLGEDDGWYFPMSRRLYEPMLASTKYNATTFINLLSEVLALFNSIKK